MHTPSWPPPTPAAGPRTSSDGVTLIAPHAADLRGCCAKCGAEPAPHSRFAKLSWMPSSAGLLVLVLGIIGAAIAFGLMTRRAGVWISLCSRCNAEWERAPAELALSTLGVGGSIVAGVVILGTTASVGVGLGVLVGGTLFSIAAAGVASGKRLRAARIGRTSVRIRGAIPYLAERVARRAPLLLSASEPEASPSATLRG